MTPKPTGKTEYQPTTEGPLWISAEGFEALGIDPTHARQVVADAQMLDQWIIAENSAHHGDLVRRAVTVWSQYGAVNRLNTALALLQHTGRIHRIG